MKKFLLVSLLVVALLTTVSLVSNAFAQDTGTTTTQGQTSTDTGTTTTGLEAFFSRVAEILGLPVDQVKTAITQAWQETEVWGGMMGHANGNNHRGYR